MRDRPSKNVRTLEKNVHGAITEKDELLSSVSVKQRAET